METRLQFRRTQKGRTRNLFQSERWSWLKRAIFPIATGLALAWFLVRVIPKPARAAYPCQRAAFPLASAFVLWLLGLKAGLLVWMDRLPLGRWRAPTMLAGILGISTLAAVTAHQVLIPLAFNSGPRMVWTRTDPANTPMGIAQGIYPGRVVWMRDTNATPWNRTSGHWWDNNTGVNPAAVERMMTTTLLAVTGATNEPQAWDNLFRHFNAAHGRGSAGYSQDETIAIKVNCNNSYTGYGDVDNQIDAAPQSVLALLRQLVNQAGVPPARIVVYEAIRVIPDRVYTPCHAEFPEVVWVDSQGTGGNGREPVNWHANAFSYSAACTSGTSIPERVYQATYLINMALLKGHYRAAVTLTSKNHFGSIPSPRNAHSLIQTYQLSAGSYSPFVDLAGARNLGGKTMLFIIDGLYGVHSVEDAVDKLDYAVWDTLFDGQWSASYFMSLDRVAIDSVGLDFLYGEFGETLAYGNTAFADDFLHEMARADDPLSGTIYRPDGTRLSSLGVHEHWNNADDKQYSRNLGLTNGIELVKIEASTNAAVALVHPASMSVLTQSTTIQLQAVVASGKHPVRQVDFYCGDILIGSATNSPFVIPWTIDQTGAVSLKAIATDTNDQSNASALVPVRIEPADALPPDILHCLVAEGEIRILFRSIPGRLYRLEASETLPTSSWASVTADQAATGELTTLTNTITVPARFYRVVRVE